MPAKYSRTIFLIFILLLVALFIYIKRNDIFAPRYLGDLHMHTTCSDGKNTYEDMIAAALRSKLNFIAITDHKFCPETLAKCRSESRILCIPGQEVTTQRVHLLALNITEYVNPKLPLIKRVKEIHRQEGFAIAAHPNAKEFYYTDAELAGSGIDAQECTGNSGERRLLPCVFDSDAHNQADLAWQFNSCLGPITTFADLKAAIISRKCVRAVVLPLLSVKNANIKE